MLLSRKTGQPGKPISGFRFPRVRHGGNLVWRVDFTPQDVADYADVLAEVPYVQKGEPADYGIQKRDGDDKERAGGYAPAGNLDVTVTSETAPNPTVSPATIDNTGWVDGYKTAALAVSHDGDETHVVTITVTDSATGIASSYQVLVGPDLQTVKAGPSKVFRGETAITSSENDWAEGHHSAENFSAVQRGAYKGMIASGTLVAPGSGENEAQATAERYVREEGETFDGRARATAGCTPFDLMGKTKDAARAWIKGKLYSVTKRLDGTFEWSKRDSTQILALKFSEDPAAYPRGSAIRDAVYASPDAELRLSRANLQVAAAGGTPENPKAGDVWIEVPAAIINARQADTLYLWSYIKTLWLPYEEGVFKNPEGGEGEGYNQVYFRPEELVVAKVVEYANAFVATADSWKGHGEYVGPDVGGECQAGWSLPSIAMDADPATARVGFACDFPYSICSDGIADTWRAGLRFAIGQLRGILLEFTLRLHEISKSKGGTDWAGNPINNPQAYRIVRPKEHFFPTATATQNFLPDFDVDFPFPTSGPGNLPVAPFPVANRPIQLAAREYAEIAAAVAFPLNPAATTAVHVLETDDGNLDLIVVSDCTPVRVDDPSQCLPEDTHSQAAHGWIEFAWSGHPDPGSRPELVIRRRNY